VYENLEVAKAETESGVKAMRQYTQNLIKTLKIRGKDFIIYSMKDI